ncbi:hypothetical protein D3C87_1651660 [compost metagenome]
MCSLALLKSKELFKLLDVSAIKFASVRMTETPPPAKAICISVSNACGALNPLAYDVLHWVSWPILYNALSLGVRTMLSIRLDLFNRSPDSNVNLRVTSQSLCKKAPNKLTCWSIR